MIGANPSMPPAPDGTPPEIRYARAGGVHIAFQTVGSGPLDLIVVPGFASNMDHVWTEPGFARFLARLARFSRLILFDKRGTGLSDADATAATLEERLHDIDAVMAAARSRRAALLGMADGAALAMLFAATRPERSRALALYGGYASFAAASHSARARAAWDLLGQGWGSGASLRVVAPSLAANRPFRDWWSRWERLGASPSAAKALLRLNRRIDVTAKLPLIRVPTLVLHRSGDGLVSVEAGRALARAIPGAHFVEAPGGDHLMWAGDSDMLLDEMEEFLTGARRAADAERVLATVLFNDIIGSTRHAAALGDRRWRALLERHRLVVRHELERFRGREVKMIGDGCLAIFDGPARAIRCAQGIADGVRALGIAVRSGLHAGEIEIIGGERDIAGIAVHIAARVAALAAAGEVLVSGTVKELVAGAGIAFANRGHCVVQGTDEELRVFAALGTGLGIAAPIRPPLPPVQVEQILSGLAALAPQRSRDVA
jgi:class 3 adenylate cyclase